jgi:hypothetical protein
MLQLFLATALASAPCYPPAYWPLYPGNRGDKVEDLRRQVTEYLGFYQANVNEYAVCMNKQVEGLNRTTDPDLIDAVVSETNYLKTHAEELDRQVSQLAGEIVRLRAEIDSLKGRPGRPR